MKQRVINSLKNLSGLKFQAKTRQVLIQDETRIQSYLNALHHFKIKKDRLQIFAQIALVIFALILLVLPTFFPKENLDIFRSELLQK